MPDRSKWRWTNLPVPEQHLSVLILSAALHASRPWLLRRAGAARAAGAGLLVSGAALALWATRTAGAVDLAHPDRLVIEGPYRYTRHPMYVGWTGIYYGLALLAGSTWPLALSPLLAVLVDRAIRREERGLHVRFGPAYGRYQSRVRSFL